MVEKLIIIGSGPAGLTAAIYSSRAQLSPLVLTGQNVGGQVVLSSEIDNYPGFPETMKGTELHERMQQQAERFGARIEMDEVTELDLSTRPFVVKTWRTTYETKVLIVATGTTPRRLEVPGEKRLRGRGVSYCAMCDGFFFKDRELAVVGGGDSAAEEANYLTKYARRVYLVHRRNRLRAENYWQERVFRHKKIQILWDSIVMEVLGEQAVTGLRLTNHRTGEMSVLDIGGVFIYIGDIPSTDHLGGQLELDDRGFIITDRQMRTNVPGVFAAGDVREPGVRQVATAVGSGAVAAASADQFVTELEDRVYGEWEG